MILCEPMTTLKCVLRSPWTGITALLITGVIVGLSLYDRPRSRHLPAAYIAAEQGISGGSLERGRREIAAWVEDHPDDFYALRLLGVVLLNLGENEEGVRYLERSIEVNPHQPGVVRYLRNIGRDPDVVGCPGAAGTEIPGASPEGILSTL
jgi:hypothetical protein